MELLFEFLGELFFEGLIEIIKSKKISLWIRIPLFLIVSFFYISLILLMIYIAFKTFQSNVLHGILIGILAVLLIVIFIVFLYKLAKGTLK